MFSRRNAKSRTRYAKTETGTFAKETGRIGVKFLDFIYTSGFSSVLRVVVVVGKIIINCRRK